jgi:hypothetical protein
MYECLCTASLRHTLNVHVLQRPDVQSAIYAKPANWTSCTTSEQLHYYNDWPDMLPYYEYFFATRPSLRILIYSGGMASATASTLQRNNQQTNNNCDQY